MSLEHAILGFLNYGSSTGYDLKKSFDCSVRHFWPADQSQIYRTLARLADRGWAEMEVVHQDDAPDRKVYAITHAGRQELHRWMTAGHPPAEVRSAELIRVFFAGQLNREEALELFRQGAVRVREQLEGYRQIHSEDKKTDHGGCEWPGADRDAFFWHLTLENGIISTEALLRWIESVIKRLEREDYACFDDPPVNSQKE